MIVSHYRGDTKFILLHVFYCIQVSKQDYHIRTTVFIELYFFINTTNISITMSPIKLTTYSILKLFYIAHLCTKFSNIGVLILKI